MVEGEVVKNAWGTYRVPASEEMALESKPNDEEEITIHIFDRRVF